MRIMCSSIPSDDLGLPSRTPAGRRGALLPRPFSGLFQSSTGPRQAHCERRLRKPPMAIAAGNTEGEVEADASSIDADHLLSILYNDAEVTANEVENWKLVLRERRVDVVLDSFGPAACAAARILGIPQVQILQADFHPDSRFTWWLPPMETPTPVAAFNGVLTDAGLPPLDRAARLLLGAATVVVGSPSTDPVPDPELADVGALPWGDPDADLPDSIPAPGGCPLVFLTVATPAMAQEPAPVSS